MEGCVVYAFITVLSLLVPSVYSKALRDRPRDVEASPINATSVLIRWEPPRQGVDGCPVSRYLIRYKSEHNARSKTKKVNGSKRSITLADLQEDTLYLVRLVSVTCRGKSQPSKWVKARTAGRPMGDGRLIREETSIPGKPEMVRTRTSVDSIILMWQAPSDNILVRGYMVGYGVGVPDVNWQYVDANTRQFTIRNLRAATQYVISLRSFNNYGKGPVVYDLIYTREDHESLSPKPMSPPIGLKSRVLSPTTAWLEWIDPSLGRPQKVVDDRYYVINYKPVPYGETKIMTVKALNMVLYDLLPDTQYEFRVQTKKGLLTTQYGISNYNKTFEAPPGSPPKNVSVTHTNITSNVLVTWLPPDHSHGTITGYLVLYTADPRKKERDWMVEGVVGGRLYTTVIGLGPNTTYYFRMQARNSKGYSPRSPTVTILSKTAASEQNLFSPVEDLDAELDLGDLVPEPEASFRLSLKTSTETTPKAEELTTAGFTIDLSNAGHPRTLPQSLPQSMPMVLEQNTQEKPNIDLTAVIKHKVSAVISWAETTTTCSGPDGRGYYTVFYYKEKDPLDRHLLNTTHTFAILEDLLPNTVYKYEVSKILEGHTQPYWIANERLDTHPQH